LFFRTEESSLKTKGRKEIKKTLCPLCFRGDFNYKKRRLFTRRPKVLKPVNLDKDLEIETNAGLEEARRRISRFNATKPCAVFVKVSRLTLNYGN
jgi:hypothetical protein